MPKRHDTGRKRKQRKQLRKRRRGKRNEQLAGLETHRVPGGRYGVFKDLRGSTVTLIAGIGAFAFGAYHFVKLAVMPHFNGTGN